MEKAEKSKRQELLCKYLEDNPFLTDDELARILGVSIQTVRLDRWRLDIPEFRERLKEIAQGTYGKVKSLEEEEWVGKQVNLEPGQHGISILEISEEMTLKRTGVARGHYIFAQANCLAVALINTKVALTGTAKISFKRPVYRGEKVIAKAFISRKKENKYIVRVTSKVQDETIFQGKFLVFAIA